MSPDIARSSAPPPAAALASLPANAPAFSWRNFRVMFSILGGLAYPFLVYWVLGQSRPWFSVLLPVAALGLLCAGLPVPRLRVIGVLGIAAIAAVAMAIAATPLLPFLPPLGVNLGLAWFFGHTLLPGKEPLITRFARLEPAGLDAQVIAYTRRLTWVWVLFFLLMAAISGTLAGMSAHQAWVWFTAVGNYACLAVLFAVEYVYRRWRFPRKDHVSPLRQMALLRAALRRRDG